MTKNGFEKGKRTGIFNVFLGCLSCGKLLTFAQFPQSFPQFYGITRVFKA